jgi:hypothetical protein
VSPLPIDGAISAKPLADIAGSMSAPVGRLAGSMSADAGESPENSAVAELSNLIASLGTLSAQAQTLPLTPPTLPGAQQPPSYQPQATDYLQFAQDSD